MRRNLFTLTITLALATFNLGNSIPAGVPKLPESLTEAQLKNVPVKLRKTIVALQDMPQITSLSGLQRLDRSAALFAVALSSANPSVSIAAGEIAIHKSILQAGLAEGLIIPIMNFIDQAASSQTVTIFGVERSESANAFAMAALNELSPKAVSVMRRDFGLPAPTNVSKLPNDPIAFRDATMKQIEPMELLGGGHGRDVTGTLVEPRNSPLSIQDIMFGSNSAFGGVGYAKALKLNVIPKAENFMNNAKEVERFSERGFEEGPFRGRYCAECGAKSSDAGGDAPVAHNTGDDHESGGSKKISGPSIIDRGEVIGEKFATKQATKYTVERGVLATIGQAAGRLAGKLTAVGVDLFWGNTVNAPAPGQTVYDKNGIAVGEAPGETNGSEGTGAPRDDNDDGTKDDSSSGNSNGGTKGDTGTSDGKRHPKTANKSDRMEADGSGKLTMPDDYQDSRLGQVVGRLHRKAIPDKCLTQFSSEGCTSPWQTASLKRKEQLDREDQELITEASILAKLIDKSCMSAICDSPDIRQPKADLSVAVSEASRQTRSKSKGRLDRPNSTPRQLDDTSGTDLNDRQGQFFVVGQEFSSMTKVQISSIPYLDSRGRKQLENLMNNPEFRRGIGSNLERAISSKIERYKGGTP